MNAPDLQSQIELTDQSEDGVLAVLQRFRAEEIQYLGSDELLTAQNLAGHGDCWGRWQTPISFAPGKMAPALRDIDFAHRLRAYLAKEGLVSGSVDQLVAEGVLVLTRLSILMRLVPSGRHGHRKGKRPKPSSISTHLYTIWPRITARAIRRKTDELAVIELFGCLTEADTREFCSENSTRIELERLDTFVARGVWSDAPPLPNVRKTTNPAEGSAIRPPQQKPEPFLPFPEGWLAEIGPRVLWVVQDMGPNLLRLLEALPQELEGINWLNSKHSISRYIARRIDGYLNRHPWVDRAGKLLSPPFRLTTSSGKQGADCFEWPPRTWEHVITMSVTLQAAHLFITLLASAGRIGEVATLVRGCVTVARDGKDYAMGHTYKLSDSLFGDARQWPAPDILSQCLGQQTRLAAAMDWLPKRVENGLPQVPRFGNALWVSVGISGTAGEDSEINFNQTLALLAQRLDMDTKPGGANVHAHRFRKTIGRLAGVALFNSPLVLKRLFGHKSIEMTLHYILCDPGVREEAEKVLRELRIIHCAEALEEIHQALHDGQPLPGNGGPGAARLVMAVGNAEQSLAQSGRTWTEGTAFDLACLLTMQGQGWRLIQENIVCSKAPGEDGLCQRKRSKGEPNTANCQPDCDNRIVFARRRRDCEQVVEGYIDLARQARDDGQLLVLASVLDNLRNELANFSDLNDKYFFNSEVQSLLALVLETEGAEELA